MPINIVFFGDSVCFGQYVSLHQCWVTLIAQKLSEKYDVVVTNSSINGSTTRQALERMSYDLSKLNMDILTIQYGMNDCNYWETDKGMPRVSPDAFGINLKEIVERARIFGAKRIFLATNHRALVSKKHNPSFSFNYQVKLSLYNQIVRDVQAVYEFEYDHDITDAPYPLLIDIEKHFPRQKSKLQELLLPDQLHLSPKGHQVYFEYVCPIIEKAIKELQCQKSSS